MAGQLPLIKLLEAIRSGWSDSDPPDIDVALADWLVRTGCAPLAWRCWQNRLDSCAHALKLQAADLTARVLYGRFREQIGELLHRLCDNGHTVVPIKGLAVSHRYYPEPHLRLMGDVDLLLPREQIPEATAILERTGFESQPQLRKAGYDDHHHTAPLYHDRWQMWVELHHSLLKPDFVAANDEPFMDAWETQEMESRELFGARVSWLSREFELAYIAAGSCLDLVEGFASERVQRNLVDATLILHCSGRPLAWQTLYRWGEKSSVGSCLSVLLGYLDRHGIANLHAQLTSFLAMQPYIDGKSLRIFNRIFDRYIAQERRLGWASRRSLPRISRSLLEKRSAWRNRATAPLELLRANRQ
jgi:hypothetical protein